MEVNITVIMEHRIKASSVITTLWEQYTVVLDERNVILTVTLTVSEQIWSFEPEH